MSQSSNKILVVDDDPTFRQGLRASLRSGGYEVDAARNAEEALEYVRQHPVGIVLLDINMPGLGGFEACRRIRAAAPQAAILMLTVRDTEDDKVLALEAGADDYVTKPFCLRELLARLHAVRRRTIGEGVAQAPVLRVGELELFVEHRTLRKAGKDVHLAPKEFEILALLMEHQNVPLTHAKILRTIWGPGGTPEKAEWQRREDRTFFAGFDDRYAPDAAGGVDRRIGISGNGDVCRYSHGALNGCGQRRGPTMQSLKPTCIEHHHVGMRLDERRKLLRAVQEDWQIA